jgi:iron complex transport system substrate-binding protein
MNREENKESKDTALRAEEVHAARLEDARRERRLKVVLCSVFLVLALGGLAVWAGISGMLSSGETSTNQTAPSEETTSSNASQTHTVVDSAGRSVEVPVDPENVAVMDSFSGELMVMIGAGSQMCGVPSGVTSDTILQTIYPALTEQPVALSGNAVNIETLMAMGTDVVLVKSTLPDDERAKLDTMGIPYVVVGYSTMEEQVAAIRLVGEVCGGNAQVKADALADYYEQTISTVKAHTATIPVSKRLSVYHSINDILLTDGTTSLGTDWIECAGGIDVSSGQSVPSGSTDYTATLEQVYAWDPDIVICNVADTVTSVKADAKWSGLSAISSGHVYNIPIGATRWGQRGDVETYLAMLWLGCTIYPQYYTDIDFKQVIIDYYRDYLGITVDDALYDQIISGSGIRSTGSNNGGGQS